MMESGKRLLYAIGARPLFDLVSLASPAAGALTTAEIDATLEYMPRQNRRR
jgi:hypothetical protein